MARVVERKTHISTMEIVFGEHLVIDDIVDVSNWTKFLVRIRQFVFRVVFDSIEVYDIIGERIPFLSIDLFQPRGIHLLFRFLKLLHIFSWVPVSL